MNATAVTKTGLKTGDLVTVPASYRVPGCRDRRTAVVESVSLNGLWFCDTTGTRHHVADAELVPLAGTAADAGTSTARGDLRDVPQIQRPETRHAVTDLGTWHDLN